MNVLCNARKHHLIYRIVKMKTSLQYLPKITTFLLWLLSLGVALVSYRFLALGLEAAFPGMMNHIANRNLAFILHISASPVALVLGLFQFRPRLRSKYPGVHRWSGRIYAVAVLIGGLAGLVLAFGISDRPIAAFGFGTLSILWIGATARAVQLAMAGRMAEHQRWVYRSYALTFAAVTLRLILPFFIVLGDMEYSQASNYVGWISWVPNLLFIEFYLRRRKAGKTLTLSA
jgi:uncharacterized membrane protein